MAKIRHMSAALLSTSNGGLGLEALRTWGIGRMENRGSVHLLAICCTTARSGIIMDGMFFFFILPMSRWVFFLQNLPSRPEILAPGMLLLQSLSRALPQRQPVAHGTAWETVRCVWAFGKRDRIFIVEERLPWHNNGIKKGLRFYFGHPLVWRCHGSVDRRQRPRLFRADFSAAYVGDTFLSFSLVSGESCITISDILCLAAKEYRHRPMMHGWVVRTTAISRITLFSVVTITWKFPRVQHQK